MPRDRAAWEVLVCFFLFSVLSCMCVVFPKRLTLIF